MNSKNSLEIEKYVRNNISWPDLPLNLKQELKNSSREYDLYVFNYSIKNQLRYRKNLVRKVFRNEQKYYELLVEKSIQSLSLFPYHLSDIVIKELRVTPYNYYIDIICYLLCNDKSYDTLPNFTAVDCLRVLGIGRNQYLALISELKTNTSKLFRKPNPQQFLPKLPIEIIIEAWWKVEVGCVLENDIKFVNCAEHGLIDDLIDFGSQIAGKFDFNILHSLYRKGLIYFDVPINGNDKISIPPLKNFVMNRVSGDYFENLLYKIFVSADEHMTISELANMLQIDLEIVQHAISLFCRLGFAKKKNIENELFNHHISWTKIINESESVIDKMKITPLNNHSILSNNSTNLIDSKELNSSNSIEYISSDGNASDFSITNIPLSNNIELNLKNNKNDDNYNKSNEHEINKFDLENRKNGKRIGFLFDSTLTAFLMMGNLSPGLKNHAVTLFEVGKLCDESMNTFLTELEKVSLLDAEGEGEVSRYFAHAVILRSTILALRNITGLDLIRLECLESLDSKTRDRLLEKKYKLIISASPLTGILSHTFTIPFLGQFYRNSDCSHIWSKLFYYHISGYGPPSLLLKRGTILKILPRLFLGYGKLLITILHTDSYIINSENFRNLNEQLKNECVLIQGYGVRNIASIHYESFPFDLNDLTKLKWSKHKGIEKLKNYLNLVNVCGYITFINTGVPDIGCDDYDVNVYLTMNSLKSKRRKSSTGTVLDKPKNSYENTNSIHNSPQDINSPTDTSEMTSFKQQIMANKLKTPDEEYFANTPESNSPANIYRSEDCNEILANELAELNKVTNLVQQTSIEISLEKTETNLMIENSDTSEEWTLLDINFGVPLFDVDCNTRICQHIVNNLFNDTNLNQLTNINADMNKKFLKFVKQCLYFMDEDMELIKFGKLLPQPRINLAFENGKIAYWNGK